jgi:membrane protein DedA with SNARE-associated domain
MSLQGLVEQYGYFAIVAGTFVEGETALVLGCFAAHVGYLKLHWVIASAFLGTLLADQLFFFLGRYQGQAWLSNKPGWQPKVSKVSRLLDRYSIPTIIGYRFVYGFRSITPFVIGMSNIATSKFIVLNVVSVIIWAVTIGVLGYVFGKTLELVLHNIESFQMLALLFVVLGITVFWLFNRRRTKARV